MIRCRQLTHKGGFYFYSIHEPKASALLSNGLEPLRQFLHSTFESCPDQYFNSGPRGSSLKFRLPETDVSCITGHPVSAMASLGLDRNSKKYKSNHMKVQRFMLENDKNTIAMEVPIWLMPEELECYNEVFRSSEPLSGHIDVLAVEDGNVWVWDYKPSAHLEKFASTQIYFYALMLSRRTSIPLEKIRCGYFDKYYAFVFRPKHDVLTASERLCSFAKRE